MVLIHNFLLDIIGNVTTLRSAYGISRPPVCRLSVKLLHPRQRLELFDNILHPLYRSVLGQWTIFGKYSNGF